MADEGTSTEEEHKEPDPVTEEVSNISRKQFDDEMRKLREELKDEHDKGKRASEDKIARLEAEIADHKKWREDKDEKDKQRHTEEDDKGTLVLPPEQHIQQHSQQEQPGDRPAHENAPEGGKKKKSRWKGAW